MARILFFEKKAKAPVVQPSIFTSSAQTSPRPVKSTNAFIRLYRILIVKTAYECHS